MKREVFEDLRFFCWQLYIKTFGELLNFKKTHNINNNADLITQLIKEYNK